VSQIRLRACDQRKRKKYFQYIFISKIHILRKYVADLQLSSADGLPIFYISAQYLDLSRAVIELGETTRGNRMAGRRCSRGFSQDHALIEVAFERIFFALDAAMFADGGGASQRQS
jgi:hypothetical protein